MNISSVQQQTGWQPEENSIDRDDAADILLYPCLDQFYPAEYSRLWLYLKILYN